MPIRNGLRRPCKKCNKMFFPTGRDCRICERCKIKIYLQVKLNRMEKFNAARTN